jgi:hypothetical protein
VKKIQEIERMAPHQRRRFLKWLGAAVVGSAVTPELRFGCLEIAGGTAHAQDDAVKGATFFIELNLRDQWDNGHVFVAPGLAKNANLSLGHQVGQGAALFYNRADLKSVGRNVYLTKDSYELNHPDILPYVAMTDACSPTIGITHGHESSNAARSPGRSPSKRGGQRSMWDNDPHPADFLGCEAHYSSSPTPAALHNHHQRSIDPTLRNGIAFKGYSRGFTAYHFGAGLSGGELDRVRSKAALLKLFPKSVDDVNVVASSAEAEAFRLVLRRMDARHLESLHYSDSARASHAETVERTKDLMYVREPKVFDLELSDAEREYWGKGVPAQGCTQNDTTIVACGTRTKAEIWEQMAYAYKLMANGVLRTVALEFDFSDLHQVRPAASVTTMGKQVSMTLARLIRKLQETPNPVGPGMMFEKTVIAIYTTDGSRSPAADSYGHLGNAKNTLILAGGNIQGGYFGDVRGTNGTNFTVHAPNATTGAAGGANTRVGDAVAWRTVMSALEVPSAAWAGFADVKGTGVLNCMLRNA